MGRSEHEALLSEIRRRIGANVRAQRTLRSWTQEQAAAECGIEPRTWQAIEAERSNVSLATLASIALGLGVDPIALLTPATSTAVRKPGRPRTRTTTDR